MRLTPTFVLAYGIVRLVVLVLLIGVAIWHWRTTLNDLGAILVVVLALSIPALAILAIDWLRRILKKLISPQ